MAQVIREETFDSPGAFLDRLNPRNPLWGNQPLEWAFRGMQTHYGHWSSVLRQTKTLFTDERRPTKHVLPWKGLWLSELITIAEFVDIADSVALALSDHTFVRQALDFLLSAYCYAT